VDARWLVYPVGAFSAAWFAFCGWRCLQAYRFAMLPLQGTMALAMALLIEATIFLLLGTVGQLTWWCYHAVMLAGFGAATLAFLRQYRGTGDLGVVVEGLFLRDQIRGIRRDDPKALTTLVAAVGAKDNETANHIDRVSELALLIGREAGVRDERLELLRWAGRLHDVGKIGVPNSVLLKPGRLTPDEFETMKLHTQRGWLIASRSPTLAAAATIIRAHHERYDGGGYPDGLRGEDIPLESRIITCADIWDALTGKRPYKDGLPPEKAAAIMLDEMQGHLDPRLLQVLFEVQGIRVAQLSNIA
jgi:HD-GYP domain-containing protein (c-di-GMP phosphodiesterase class II)